MLTISSFDHIYLFRPYVDFRRGIRGLCSIVQEQMKLSPFDNYLFIFCNRSRDRIKTLYWDKTGFAMWYKVLEDEKYRWPFHLEEECIGVEVNKLNDFLVGLDPWQVPHKKLNFSMI